VTKQVDVAILGSGPAGLTAAIYASRANLKVLVIEGPTPGGQLTTTTEVENFPGFPEGVYGPVLIDKMKKQAERFGAIIGSGKVEQAELTGSPKKIILNTGEILLSRAVILCLGSRSRMLGLEKEKELLGYGLSTCATCDGAFHKNKEVAVVGGGDSACEESLFLTRFASKVYLIHRRDTLRASKIMQNRIFQNPKIEIIWNSVVVDLVGSRETLLKGIIIKNLLSGEEKKLEVSGLFLAIGHVPDTEFLTGVQKDSQGYIIRPDPFRCYTNIPGVFVAGDCTDHIYRQAITAAGLGCMAAIDCYRWLEENP
jgi:thioredoxin reductase (NADPH)